MGQNMKSLLKDTLTAISLGYRVVRGIDYRTLSEYILKINQHKDINAILFEVSRCLKDILDYELFGFALKHGDSMDVWIDPRAYSMPFSDFVSKDFDGQNIDQKLHYIESKTPQKGQNYDTIDVNNLISYKVIDGNFQARLYILPKKKMLYHHDTIISTIINSISIALEKNLSIQELRNAAAFDPLTNCYNRRALSTFIESDIAYAQRHRNELAVIMIDIDNFKEINDCYGHLAGDAVLKELAALVSTMVRKSDYLARFGGEEFLLVLPDTRLYYAVQLAHKLQKKIEAHTVVFNNERISLTASFGVAGLEDKKDGASLLAEADSRLYKAKSIGKNTVVPSLLPCFADRHFVSQGRTHPIIQIAQMA
jgi:diguanylate cyclase (GGDEF)-like protein